MSKRTPYQVKIEILTAVKEKSVSYTKLQTKLSTNYDSIKNNCNELQDYEFVVIEEIKEHPKNGKPSHEVSITNKGLELLKKKTKH